MTQSVTELGLPTPKERRRLREAAELTHEELAAAMGVTATTVRSWETGRTDPRGRKREAYAKFLARLGADRDSGANREAKAAANADAGAPTDTPAARAPEAARAAAEPGAGAGAG
ncbi:helix-turn-helix transcriptional regulator, partial [Streptomyces sp. ISL-66]|uniref:helix-turn-helix domain-containing protein n=1 Tax=Streptomyces sp. ISL-66 TaxID=2819186 RepID=UPI001BE59F51